jgi:hypothetical protein
MIRTDSPILTNGMSMRRTRKQSQEKHKPQALESMHTGNEVVDDEEADWWSM